VFNNFTTEITETTEVEPLEAVDAKECRLRRPKFFSVVSVSSVVNPSGRNDDEPPRRQIARAD
jgi:hypothetical protein